MAAWQIRAAYDQFPFKIFTILTKMKLVRYRKEIEVNNNNIL